MTRLQGWVALALTMSMAGCGGSDPTYTLSANVTGLVGTGLVLRADSGGDVSVAANGTVAFSGSYKKGASYSVAVANRPTSPSQTCSVTPGSGAFAKENVSVSVSCVVDTFAVRVAVTGVAGTGVTLQLNNGANLAATSSGTHEFQTRLQQGAAYAVSVLTQPTNPFQECTVSAPTGLMPATDITLAVSCLNTYVISGTAIGLSITRARTPLVLTEPGGGGQDVSINADGTFALANRIPVGRSYTVTVKSAPGNPDMTCTITGGSGIMPNSDINSVNASCQRARGKFAYMGRFPNAVVGASIAADGTLSTTESVTLDYLPQSIAVDPSARFLYLGPGFSQIGTGISSFRINPGTGQLAQIGSKTSTTSGINFIAVEPQGRFLFASNLYGGPGSFGSISVYAIDALTGQLSEVPGSPFDSSNNPYGIAFDATGRYVYTTGDRVRAFSINQTTGALTELAASPVANSAGAQRLFGTPDGRFIYVRGQTGITPYLKGFRIQPDGALQEFAISVDPADFDVQAAVDPKGRYIVFFRNGGGFPSQMKVSVYAISAADGTLSRAPSPDWIYGYPPYPIPAAFDPSGSWLFVMQAPGTLGQVWGTASFQVGGGTNPLALINGSAYDIGDGRVIAVR